MAGESAPTLLPPPAPEGGDAFQQIVNQNFDPVFVVGEPAVDPMRDTLDQRLAVERGLSLGSPAIGGQVEHPFGNGILVALPEAAKGSPRTPTPAKVEVTGTDEQGNVTEVRTGPPD